MKKLLALALCLLWTAALAVPALADMIWEPDDDFYRDHWQECVPSDEEFLAREDTVLWESPRDDTVAGILSAGGSAATPYIWTDRDGGRWGYVEFRADGAWTRGWVHLSDPGGAGPDHSSARIVSLVLSLIVAVIAVTAALLIAAVLRKRRNGT